MAGATDFVTATLELATVVPASCEDLGEEEEAAAPGFEEEDQGRERGICRSKEDSSNGGVYV